MNLTPQDKIKQVLDDIHKQGFSKIPPFCIGKVEQRMKTFAQNNHIPLASDEIYITQGAIAHATRDSKIKMGRNISLQSLIDFPANYKNMELFFDGKGFIYTDKKDKFIIHPNYEIKLLGEKKKKVNFITASTTNPEEFTLKKYIKL